LISLLLQPFLSIKKKRRRGESERGKVLFLSWMELKLSEERWENGEIQKSTVNIVEILRLDLNIFTVACKHYRTIKI
jgi:hypothetical protein